MIQTDLSSFSYKKGSLVPFCKRCRAQHFYRDGKNKNGIQRYECRVCGMRFVWTSDLPKRRCFSNIINFAVELYTDLRKAISLEGVAEIIKKVFNVVFSYETIRQWVLAATKTISRRGFAHLLFVVWKTYILAWELRLLPKDELSMLKSCWKQLRKRPTNLVYDKKGDCEAHHNWLESQGIRSIAPVRKGARRGKYRRKLMKNFPQKTYNKRNRNENVNWMFKNRYGEALNAYTVKGRRAELTTKVLAHNLWARLKALLIRTFQYRLQILR